MPKAENFGDFITADHKILSEETQQSSIRRCGTGFGNTVLTILPCKTKTSQETQKSRKSFILTIPLNLASPVKNYPGIIVRQRHTDRKQMGLLKEQCAE